MFSLSEPSVIQLGTSGIHLDLALASKLFSLVLVVVMTSDMFISSSE